MLTVRFYTFSKKENSTKQPGIADSFTEFSCLLKSGTGVISPALEIRTDANPSVWNYCYIVEFSRYYFIQEWTYNMGDWICSLKVDVLASWKTNIGDSTQYILRAADTTIQDSFVIDGLYPTTTYRDNENHEFGTSLATSLDDAGFHFVVGIINNDDTNYAGCASYYCMNSFEIRSMKHRLMTDNDWIGNVSTTADSVTINKSKVDINPYQYVISCRFFPCAVPHGSTELGHIHLGWWDAGLIGYDLTKEPNEIVHMINIPRHPQVARGNYMNSSAFSAYCLDWAGFHFDIDADLLCNANTLTVYMYPDYYSGMATVRLLAEYREGGLVADSWIVGEITQQLAVEIPIAQINYTPPSGPLSIARGIGQAAAALFGGSNMNNPMEANVNAISETLNKSTITGSFSGQPGSLSAIKAHPKPMLTCSFKRVADETIADCGRPVCDEKQISTIASGFIKCQHAHISLPCTEPEQVEVVNYLDGGFFYE